MTELELTSMEPLKKERAVVRRFFTKYVNELEAILSESDIKSYEEATIVHEKLQQHEDQLKILDSKVKTLIITSPNFDEKTLEIELDGADIYHTKWLRIHNMFISKSHSQQYRKVGENERSSKNIHLPKLEFQCFDGDVKNWLSYWGQFSKIDRDTEMDICDKYQYLLQSMQLGSDVRNLVESFPPTAYTDCLEQLKARYGREELLVQVYVRELLAIVLNKHSINKTSMLYDKLSAQLRALESLGVTKDKYAAFLLPMVESALPQDLLKIWERCREDSKKTSTDLSNILNFLKKEVESEQRILIAKNTFYKEDTEVKVIEKKTAECLLSSAQPKTRLCIWCEKDTHSSLECYKVHKMTMDERKHHLREKKVCMLCLKKGHHVKTCKTYVKCLICLKRHSTILCTEQKANEEKHHTKPEPATSLSTTHQKEEILLQTVIVEVEYNNKKLPVRALFDSGSQRTYIKKDIINKLDIPPCRKEVLSHCLFGGIQTKTKEHNVYNININSMDKSFKIDIVALSQNNICGNIPKVNTSDVKLDRLLNKHGIILTDKTNNVSEIGLLIGADCLGFLFTGTMIELKDGLVAIKSKLGWTLQGKLVSVNANNNPTSILQCTCDNILTEYWSLETLGIRDPAEVKTKAEATADTLNAFNETLRISNDNRYEVKLPFKTNCEDLLPNYQNAKLRLESMTRKLVSSGKFHDYDQILKGWVDLGIIEKIESDIDIGHYLPHRPVIKKSSLTSNIRPVFDASAKDKKGLSLNACLEKGNNMIDFIPNLINSFRTGAIGITSDIEKAFLQICVSPPDRDYLKFLWFEDETLENIVTYRHCRVVFGLTSSPFLLSATLQHHINKIKEVNIGKLVETANLLGKSFYVDNCLVSVDSEQEAITFIREAKEIMQAGKFNLRMWVASSGLNETGKQIVSILGLNWDATSDELFCNIDHLPSCNKVQNITKRDLLSLTQRVFDPIGYTAPVMLTPKLILQKVWHRQLAWDKEIPSDLFNKFQDWYKYISYLNECRVPRRLTDDILKECEVSLHLFCDASKDGCGACVLVRAEKGDKVTVQLVSAKSRVTPPQKLTIPRLELTAALMGSRLLTQVRENTLLRNCPQYCWTDSGVTLCWIKRELPLNTFVGNRVKEIRQHTDTKNWFHIPGDLNWADLASRGCNAKILLECRWWEGPEWLHLAPDEWPHSELLVDEHQVHLETKMLVCNTSTICKDNLLYRLQTYFSKYSKIIRMMAWIIRFIENIKHKNKRKGEISYKEFEKAEKVIIKLIQDENTELLHNRSGNLTQFKDKDGLVRIKTKLLLTNLPECVRTPYLLPGNIPLIQLMVRQRHVQLQHAGTNQLIADVRTRFWIIGIRRLVKSVISQCIICTRYRAKAVTAPTAPLPIERIVSDAAFQTTGVDLAGPLYLRGGEKCWIVLYTCAVYRAVHLELTRSLSTEAFIMTLRRFIARRGRVNMMISDQGTNFHGTKGLLNSLDWEEIQRQSTIQRISWKMNAPSAAWWGGFWERLIRILKDLLKRILCNATVSYDELETIICDCEATMNSRPLTYISDDKSECLEPLTPAYFIQPTPHSDVTDLDMIDRNNLNCRLQYIQKLRDQFRQRFKAEYLNFLVQKGKEKKDLIQVGDIVIMETDEKRIKWPLGIIEELITGRDGIQRAAKIKTSRGTKVRPVQRLYKLEISGDNIPSSLKASNTPSISLDEEQPATVPIVSEESEVLQKRPELLDKPPQSTRSGRQLEDGYTFHDYNIKLNDVIQVMVRVQPEEGIKEDETEPKTDGELEKRDDDHKVEYKDAESVLYAVGDLVDMKDREQGAWFEAKIVRIVQDPDTPSSPVSNVSLESETDSNKKIIDLENVNDLENKPPGTLTGENSISKRGIARYFSKTAKYRRKSSEKELSLTGEKEKTDANLLYKVELDDPGEDSNIYCKLKEIRPRARTEIDINNLKLGQKVMVNHNTDDRSEKGYWYDFKVSEIKKLRTSYELIGTLYLGPEAVPQNDTKVSVHDKIYAIEDLIPLAQRTDEHKKMMMTAPQKRSQPLNCLTCRDDEDAQCKDCGCYLCSGKEFPEKIILCDECNKGFHMTCLAPPLTELPEEDWYCPSCKRDPNDVIAPGAAKQTKKSMKSNRDWGRGMACAGKTKTCAMPPNHFGPIPGIEVGMCWRFRIQLSESGVHRPPVSGIHGRDVEGAYSIVLSGGYEDDVDYGNEFTYTGSGGRDLSGNKRTAEQSCDQTLTRENKALARNCAVKQITEEGGDAGDNWRSGRPVRVVRSYKMLKHFPKYAPKEGIRYDGIYKVVKYYPEKGLSGYRVWKYLLRRDDPNPAPWEPDAKLFPIVYPDGYLEAEAEKKALKEKNGKGPKGTAKNNKKRALRECNQSLDSSVETSPPTKKQKRNDDKPKKKGRSPKQKRQSVKSPEIPKNTGSIASLFARSPPAKPRVTPQDVSALTSDERDAIAADTVNAKLWKECLKICEGQARKDFVEHVTQVFLCIICQDVAVNPVTTACLHNFCLACLKQAFKSTGSKACPCCRQSLAKYQPETNVHLMKALRSVLPGYDAGKK